MSKLDPPHPSDPPGGGSAASSQGSGHGRGAEAGTVIRSEEQLRVGTERVEAGRALLSKHVVEQTITRTVPVSHEQLRIRREPLGAGAPASTGGSGLSELEHEFVLVAEQPVVQTDVVAVERVRLGTVVETGEQSVTQQLRKEQIELEQDGSATGRD